MAETDIAMPESTPVDSRPAFAIVEELKTKFGENFYVQPTCENFPTVWVERARVQEVLMFLRTVSKPYVMLFDLSRWMSVYASIVMVCLHQTLLCSII